MSPAHLSTCRRAKTAASLMALTALTATTGACTSDEGGAVADPGKPTQVSPSKTALVTPAEGSDHAHDTTYDVVAPVIAHEVIARYGNAGAAQATQAAVDFSKAYTFDARLARTRLWKGTDKALAMTEHMTPAAARRWRAAITEYNAGVEGRVEHGQHVLTFTLFQALAPRWDRNIVFRKGGPVAVDPRITSIESKLLPDGRVEVTLESAAEALVLSRDSQTPGTRTMERTQTFTMKDTADGWKIDAMAGTSHWGGFSAEE